MPDKLLVCQVCGQSIAGNKVYLWNNDERLPCHPDLWRCGDRSPQLFADFLNRNRDYINGRGEPSLLNEEVTQ